ncbi:hypothetical protein V8E36_007954 [Tilletia maclaganii]
MLPSVASSSESSSYTTYSGQANLEAFDGEGANGALPVLSQGVIDLDDVGTTYRDRKLQAILRLKQGLDPFIKSPSGAEPMPTYATKLELGDRSFAHLDAARVRKQLAPFEDIGHDLTFAVQHLGLRAAPELELLSTFLARTGYKAPPSLPELRLLAIALNTISEHIPSSVTQAFVRQFFFPDFHAQLTRKFGKRQGGPRTEIVGRLFLPHLTTEDVFDDKRPLMPYRLRLGYGLEGFTAQPLRPDFATKEDRDLAADRFQVILHAARPSSDPTEALDGVLSEWAAWLKDQKAPKPASQREIQTDPPCYASAASCQRGEHMYAKLYQWLVRDGNDLTPLQKMYFWNERPVHHYDNFTHLQALPFFENQAKSNSISSVMLIKMIGAQVLHGTDPDLADQAAQLGHITQPDAPNPLCASGLRGAYGFVSDEDVLADFILYQFCGNALIQSDICDKLGSDSGASDFSMDTVPDAFMPCEADEPQGLHEALHVDDRFGPPDDVHDRLEPPMPFLPSDLAEVDDRYEPPDAIHESLDLDEVDDRFNPPPATNDMPDLDDVDDRFRPPMLFSPFDLDDVDDEYDAHQPHQIPDHGSPTDSMALCLVYLFKHAMQPRLDPLTQLHCGVGLPYGHPFKSTVFAHENHEEEFSWQNARIEY